MDNGSIAERYRRQAEARLEMAGLLLSDSPAVQFSDRDNRRVTRANLGVVQGTVCRIGRSARAHTAKNRMTATVPTGRARTDRAVVPRKPFERPGRP